MSRTLGFRWRIERLRAGRAALGRGRGLGGNGMQEAKQAVAAVLNVGPFTLVEVDGQFCLARLVSAGPGGVILESRWLAALGTPVTLTVKSPAGELVEIPGTLGAAEPGHVAIVFDSPGAVHLTLVDEIAVESSGRE